MKSNMTTIRIKPHIHEKLKEYARKEGRSLSNFLLHCSATYIREHFGDDVFIQNNEKKKPKKK
jgi:hypothetical protein